MEESYLAPQRSSRFSPFRLAIATAFLLFGSIALFVALISHDTSASFESSDGKWGSREMQYKKNFDLVVEEFERYKLTCNPGEVFLVRTTPKYLTDVLSWPSYVGDKKWSVPFRKDPQLPHRDKFPDCWYWNPSVKEEGLSQRVKDAASLYLERLPRPGIVGLFTI